MKDSAQLLSLLRSDSRPRVLVVGDVMLDRYVWGEADRISPEAPIPVLRVSEREERLGGAGSVVAMLAALDAHVIPATVLADDADGQVVRRLLLEATPVDTCLLTAPNRVTTVKERILGRTQSRQPQQMVRVDHERVEPVDRSVAERMVQAIESCLPTTNAVLISDYGKGVCDEWLCRQLIDICRRHAVPVIVDPARDVSLERYRRASCVTPNRAEASFALAMRIDSVTAGIEAARRLLHWQLDAALVTLDRDGIAWADRNGRARCFPVKPRQVSDITGAGDMVLSALGYGVAQGADWPLAVELANLAGGLEVERLGVVPLSRDELILELNQSDGHANGKIVSEKELMVALRRCRESGQRIVMTNGCFDLLHPGHVASLRFAAAQGDFLVVAINSDFSVRQLKGPGRPIIDQQGRAEMVAAVEGVDCVVIFDDLSVAPLVERVAPDVLVKSATYSKDAVVGHEIVERLGGRVMLAPVHGDYSTSNLISRIAGEAHHPQSPEDSHDHRTALP